MTPSNLAPGELSSGPVRVESAALDAGTLLGPAWSGAGSMHVARQNHVAALLSNGQVLVAGGHPGNLASMATAEVYNPATNVWMAVGSMATARRSFGACTLSNGKVLVAGGNASLGDVATAELFNPSTNTWSTTGSMVTAREDFSTTCLSDGRVLVAGGSGASGILSSAEVYNPTAGTWSSAGTIPFAVHTQGAVLLTDGRVLIAGGNGALGPISEAAIWNPGTNAWTATASMSTTRAWFALNRLADGRVLASAGLVNVLATTTATAEIFTPATGTWSAAASLGTARYSGASATVASGPMVISGVNGGAPLTSYEVYDAIHNTWSQGTLTYGAVNQTATALTPTSALVAGGNTGSNATASAQRYGVCSNAAAHNGTACDSGNKCTQNDSCQSGVCVAGPAVVCAATDTCHTAGTCSPSTGLCSNPVATNGTTCSDGNACTQSDSCQNGTCTGSNPVTCAASDQCHTAGTCNTSTGACSNPALANGTSCSDGNACTRTDTCQSGTCTGANPVTCVASDQCHTAGTCSPSTGTCSNPAAANGTSCSDGNACTQSDACSSGACVGSNPVICAGDAGTCNPASGTCPSGPPADGGTGDGGAGSTVVAGGSGDPALSGATIETLSFCPGASGLTYSGTGSGGSGQGIAPSASFLGGEVCLLPPATETAAAGLVIGLDAIAFLGDTVTAGSTSCNGVDTTDCSPEATGTAYDVTINRPVHGAYTFSGWRDVFRVLYAGVTHDPNDQGCDSEIRRTIANNWGNLFETQCSGGNCTQLRHLYRPDDGSPEAQVFAEILGLAIPTSASALNGFGKSPYCNALNWDVAPANASCALGSDHQWVGPGGVPDPTAADGTHRRPPPGTWGDAPDLSQGALGADVLATSYQDNDPIRRPCIGTQIAGNTTTPAEEVCNLDGALGLVLPVPSVDFVSAENGGRSAFPTSTCTGFAAGPPETVFTCAPLGSTHGACPDGAHLKGSNCQLPVNASGSSLCENEAAHWPSSTDSPQKDGRIFNSVLFSGGTGYTQAHIPNPVGGAAFALPFTGHWGRIHSQVVAWDTTNVSTKGAPCQQNNATSQIGCLAQADPCGFGFAASAALTWNGSNQTNTVAIKVNQELPLPACIQDLTYALWHKLYLNSDTGFSSLTGAQLALAKCEADPNVIDTALVDNQLIPLALPSPNSGNPYCEDFDEQLLCARSSNSNACAGNGAAGLPTASTTCGNGVVEAYEECDNGTANANGGATGSCSLICRLN